MLARAANGDRAQAARGLLASRFQDFIHYDSLGNSRRAVTRTFASDTPDCRDRTPLHLMLERRKNERGIPVLSRAHQRFCGLLAAEVSSVGTWPASANKK